MGFAHAGFCLDEEEGECMKADAVLKASLIEYIVNYEYDANCDVMKLIGIVEQIDYGDVKPGD